MKFPFLVLTFLLSTVVFAKVELAGYFADHMVLQRDRANPVWGKASPGDTVTVAFAGQTKSTVADAKGHWCLTLDPMPASTVGREMVVSSCANGADGVRALPNNPAIRQPDNQTILQDILVGDVWFIGGGMNVGMTFGWGVDHADEARATAKDFPLIRLASGKDGARSLLPTDETGSIKWTVSSISGSCAVGYFFARELHRRTGVPVGIVSRSWSWCSIDPYVSVEGLAAVPEAEKLLSRQRASYAEGLVTEPPFASLHNGMFASLARIPFAGAVWYEGETGTVVDYAVKLRALLAGWRLQWGEDFPICVIELQNPGKRADQIRAVQREAVAKTPRVGFVTAADLPTAKGEYFTKAGKLEIGQRLAAWAADATERVPPMRQINIFNCQSTRHQALKTKHKTPNTRRQVPIKVEVSRIFTDHMVLPRDRPVPVWGTAAPGEAVTVVFAGQSKSTVADAKGDWSLDLDPMPASKIGHELVVSASVNGADGVRALPKNQTIRQPDNPTIKQSNNQTILQDILVGDVWLISGQSNAEMSMKSVLGKEEILARAKDFPAIRRVKVDKVNVTVPQTKCPNGPWEVGTNGAVLAWTAVGYYFARAINEKTDVPIGILDDNWSGCRIEPFIDPQALAGAEGLEADAAAQKKAEGLFAEAKAKLAAWRGGPLPRTDVVIAPSLPYGGQFNAMIHPYLKFPIKGCVWYQGCSNGSEGESYGHKLRALVNGWRKDWGEAFPFYVVQLASYGKGSETVAAGGNGYAKIREAQRRTASALEKSGLVVTIDIGNPADIHPKNKRDVGERAARWALKNEYGFSAIEPSGPLFRACVAEGNRLRVSFDHVSKGLMVGEKGPDTPGVAPKELLHGELKGFAIAGADRNWYWAKAVIDGNDVLVSAPEVAAPVAVRYAYRHCPLGASNLYNRDGLPASPFRSDDW